MRRTTATALALGVLLAPIVVAAQVPFGTGGANRLRDRARPQSGSPRLDENLEKLKSDEPETRIEGIRGLIEIEDPKGNDYLIAAANDPDMRVCVKAIDALGDAKIKEAVPLLTQKLFMRNTEPAAKQRVFAALGKIGDKRATGAIVDFLSRDVDREVHGNAIFALGEIGDPDALPALERLTQETDDEVLRALARDTIRKIRERPDPDLVVPALAVDRRENGAPQTP